MSEIIEKIISREAVIYCTIQIGGLAAKYRFEKYRSWLTSSFLYIKEKEQSIDIPVRMIEQAAYEKRNGMIIGRLPVLDERSVSITFCIKENSAPSTSGRTRMRHKLLTNH